MELSVDELKQIRGGAFSGTLINALIRGINSFLDLGRSLGSAIRMIGAGKYCKL